VSGDHMKRRGFCYAVPKPRAGREATMGEFVNALRACLGLRPIGFMTKPKPHTMGCTCGACSNRFGRRSTSEEA
jgi:hypothetical protein